MIFVTNISFPEITATLPPLFGNAFIYRRSRVVADVGIGGRCLKQYFEDMRLFAPRLFSAVENVVSHCGKQYFLKAKILLSAFGNNVFSF